MTDIDATDADADAPTATPSGKASAALPPAPSVDTCSDEFIDKAEDEIQAEMDRHYDNAKKGEEVRPQMSCTLLPRSHGRHERGFGHLKRLLVP